MTGSSRITVHVRSPELVDVCRRLESRYADELADFIAKDENDDLPLWMNAADKLTARAMVQAKRDVMRDLVVELSSTAQEVNARIAQKGGTHG